MPRNEEGEFELVLGNRQLLSVFFIVVVLLGVFFVMGYVLGKNTGPAAVTEVAGTSKPADTSAPNPIIIDKSAAPKSSAVGQPAPQKPPPAEAPAKRTERTEPPPSLKTETEERVGQPPAGSMFLQVAAVGRAEADVVAKVLKSKGYSIWIAPSDKEKIQRVLVGPIQKSDIGKTRTALVDLGFSPFARNY